MNKNILIASYYFPPYPGIGGRRMAKFCKYLVKKGFIVHVIKVENPYSETSSWLEDVDHENIKTYSLPLHYPKVLLMAADGQKENKTIFQRINYKLTTLFYSKIQKKRIYDPTFLWEKPFTELATSLIEKFSIRNFIVSVTPHYYALYAVRLKKIFPELNIIIDFRDPWLSLRDYGLQNMTRSQLLNEKAIVSEVINKTNYIISPSKFILDEFRPLALDDSHTFEIPHAYDEDDVKEFLSIENSSDKKSEKTTLIYAGTLYSDILPSLLKLKETLSYLKKNHLNVYTKLEFDFYVSEQYYSENFKEHPNVMFHNLIGKKIFEKIRNASALIILYAEHNKNFRTTKFYEYLPFRKNYLYIGPQGDTHGFIIKNQLGHSFSDGDDVKLLANYFIDLTENKLNYNPKVEFNHFSFEKQTETLINLFQ